MISMVLIGYLASVLLDHANYLVPNEVRLPISCVIFLAGLVIGAILEAAGDQVIESETDAWIFLDGERSLSVLDPHALFYVILPPLLYESAANMSWHVLRKVLTSSVILAFPGVVLNMVLTAVMSKPLLTDGTGNLLSWEAVLLLSTILSATDPVAVVAALRNLGAPAKLSLLIEGESLLNDGSAVVVYLVFQDFLGAAAPDDEKLCPGQTPSGGCIVGKFLQLAVGGSLLGVAVGLVVSAWIEKVRFVHMPVLEVTITLVGVYGSFFLAERLGCSGVLADVVFGMMMAAVINPRLSHEARHDHHTVVSVVAYICDKMIFFAAGMICTRFSGQPIRCSSEHVAAMAGQLVVLYIILHVCRVAMVLFFAPVLARLGYGLTFKESVILVWGGLRGALALCMGLMVQHNEYIQRSTAEAIAFYVSGIVFLTMLINGTTVDGIFKRLRMYPPRPSRVAYLQQRMAKMQLALHDEVLKKLRKHWLLKEVNLECVLQCMPDLGALEYDEAGRPVPTGVVPLDQTLLSLEHAADATGKRQSMRPSESERRDRQDELTDAVACCLTDAVAMAMPGGAGDVATNVLENGDCVLRFRQLGQGDAGKLRSTGLYVSHRPLSRLGQPAGDASFAVTIEHPGEACEAVLVGVVTRDRVRENQEEQLLGRVPVSVGLDCTSGEVVYNMGRGPQVVRDLWEVVSELHVRAQPSLDAPVLGRKLVGETLRGFEVDEWVELAQEPGFVCRFQEPTEPRQSRSKWQAQATRRERVALQPLEGPAASAAAAAAVVVGRPLPAAGDTVRVEVKQRAEGIWCVSFYLARGRRTSPPELLAHVALGPVPPQELHPVVEFHSWLASEDSWSGRSLKLLPVTMASQGRHTARVSLSFLPNINREADSLQERYSTLFSTLRWHYGKAREHRIIGDWAMYWLDEAASEAADCANMETNASCIKDFIDKGKQAEPLRETTALLEAARPAGTSSQHIFEPLIVEYLVVARLCMSPSLMDRYPASWPGAQTMSCLGYSHTSAKMECLYGFIECHERVLAEWEAFEQFPTGAVHCVRQVVSFARRDLAWLQELTPRRSFFCKHALALKIVASSLMRRLEAEAEHGWIEEGDAAGLVELSRELLAKVEMHHPGAPPRTQWALYLLGLSTLPCGDISPEGAALEEAVRQRWLAVLQELDAHVVAEGDKHAAARRDHHGKLGRGGANAEAPSKHGVQHALPEAFDL